MDVDSRPTKSSANQKDKNAPKDTKKSTPFNRSLVLAKPIKTSWKKKMELKNEKMALRALEQSIKAEKQALIDEKKRRREENLKRREENARKAEIVQPIKNLRKIGKKGAKRIRKA